MARRRSLRPRSTTSASIGRAEERGEFLANFLWRRRGFLLEVGCTIQAQRGTSVSNDRQRRVTRPDRSITDVSASRVLPKTADPACGSMNLVSQPRAGNISSDMRAGLHG